MRVQGHPGSKFIAPVESPLLVSCLTSFESNIVSLTYFEIFDIKAIFYIKAMVKINSASGSANIDISDFYQKQW